MRTQIEEMAKAMYEAGAAVAGWQDPPEWEDISNRMKCQYEVMARAALEYYSIPPEAQRGAVGDAVAALIIIAVMYDDERSAGTLAMALYEAAGMAKRALRAFGKEVAEDAVDTPSDADAVD